MSGPILRCVFCLPSSFRDVFFAYLVNKQGLTLTVLKKVGKGHVDKFVSCWNLSDHAVDTFGQVGTGHILRLATL